MKLFFTLLFICNAICAVTQPYPGEFTEGDLAKRAKNRTRTLEKAIQRMIEYGHTNKAPDEFIQEVLLNNFVKDATIETASVSRLGKVVINPPISYEQYFENLWRKAQNTPSLKVYFSNMKVKKLDTYRYRATVEFVQEYESARYMDTTTKEVEIHFIPKNGTFVEKIGTTRVVDIKRK